MRQRSVTPTDIAAALVIAGSVAAVVRPALGNDALAQAQRITCVSNMRQLGLAMLQYSQDYDLRYPSGTSWHGSGAGWASQMYPYTQSTAVYRCPIDSSPHAVVSYGYNSNFVHPATGRTPITVVDAARFGSPANTVALFEVSGNALPSGKPYALGSEDSPLGETASSPSEARDGYYIAGSKTRFGGRSPAGRGLAIAGDLVGQGDHPVAGQPRLRYATGIMDGSSNSPAYVEASVGRHEGVSNFLFADGHVAAEAADQVSSGYDAATSHALETRNHAIGTGALSKLEQQGDQGVVPLRATFSVR